MLYLLDFWKAFICTHAVQKLNNFLYIKKVGKSWTMVKLGKVHWNNQITTSREFLQIFQVSEAI